MNDLSFILILYYCIELTFNSFFLSQMNNMGYLLYLVYTYVNNYG